MSDVGPVPRRMDGFARPVQRPEARVAPQPAVRPVAPQRMAQPVGQPVVQQPRPIPTSQPEPVLRQQSATQPTTAVRTSPKRRGGWWVALQFVVGLLVIAGVAAAIVALYIRYYQ